MLSYHKDDHAMHPIYECPENFWVSLIMPTPTATFPEIFLWAFLPIYAVNMCTKFEIRSFTCSSYNRGYPKIWQSLDTPTLPLLQSF